MDVKSSTPHCKYCSDEGYIHTCMNCYKPAIYDYEFGFAICDYCFLLGEKQNIFSEKCRYCKIEDTEIEIPKVGDKLAFPSFEQMNKVVSWMYLIKIPFDKSYDVVKPICVENSTLEYFSYVENKIQHIQFERISEMEIVGRTLSSVSWSTNLIGLVKYIKEKRGIELMINKQFIRLVFFSGGSWDVNNFTQNDILEKRNTKENYFSDGLTLSIEILLKNNGSERFPYIKKFNDSLYFDPKKSTLYLIESINKFEIL